MSIKHFSKEEIINVAKDILKNNTFIGVPNTDKLLPDTSLRETLDISSLEIAELIVALEEKYHVNMEWTETARIDTLNDIYNAFVISIAKTRKSAMMLNPAQKQK
jgi:acyl carrier protein